MSDVERFSALLRKLPAAPEGAAVGATDAEITAANESLSIPIPARWQQILGVRNGGEIRPRSYVCFVLRPVHQISGDASLSLVVGEEPEWGNLLTLSAAEQTADGDCSVRWISPSGEEQGADWDSIAAFLHWWLEEKNEQQQQPSGECVKGSLRVVLDARPLSHGQPGGFRGYVRSLVAGLAERDGDEELLFYVDRPLPAVVGETLPPRVQIRVLPSNRLKTDQHFWGRQVRRDAPDLVMGTVNYLPLTPASVPAVVTIHDAIGISARPWEKGQPLTLRARLMAAYWAAMTRRSARVARHIITDSQGAAGEIAKALKVAPERLTVVPVGIHVAPRPSVERDTRTVLAFASPEPRKNFSAVLEAFTRLCVSSLPPRLEIVCTYDAGVAGVEAALAARGITDYHLLRRPTDAELAAAYARATVFVWPSFREGFGMPPLEAMQTGCPVVSSSAPVMPEILGDAPLYADPSDPVAFAGPIARLLADTELCQTLSARGRAHAASFTCRRMADETAAVWRMAAG